MFDNFFFVGLPYIAILLFVLGLAYRTLTGFKTFYRGKPAWGAWGDFLWTTRSTGFFGRATIGPAALCLHWGLIVLIVAHLIGFIGGAANWGGWVSFFRWTGMFGGVLALYGACWAFVRRLLSAQLRAMSTLEDYIVLLFLIVTLALGLYHSIVQFVWGVSYPVGRWLVSLFTLQPDASWVATIPLTMKLHIIIAFTFLAYFPFTKLVHAFSYPLAYITRPYISMRRYVGVKK